MVDIYLITNLINNKQYVGKSVNGYQARFKQHCLESSHTYVSEAIHKYGADNFTVKLIRQCSDDEWRYWETFYIKQYKTHWSCGGYNLTWGGDSNPMEDERVKAHHKEVCSSLEHRRKISESSERMWREHPRDENYRNKVRENNRKNADRVYAGFRRYNAFRSKPIAELDKDGNILNVFCSISEACRYCNRDPQTDLSNILSAVDRFNKNGTRSKAYGKYWSYTVK